ncbi:MFS transporter [Dactylosporangium sp. NPDC005555]|uniref:MFS transporter n=1 Tax=Dactylosporangium sp. NPDC005555 TaxID=3154889 RepID=UPI0033B073CA
MSPRRVTAALYGFAFLDDFVLLYPLYALLFSDTGLSVWQISSLFFIWSATGVLFEVPSGAWADAVSRKLLLCVGPLLTTAGFALWVWTPSYWAFALGFLLWGIRGALTSGALEALVYEELDRLGAADRYAQVMGRSKAVGMTAVVLAMGLATPVFDYGGFPAVGVASIAACLATAAVATLFPEHGTAAAPGDDDGWAAQLRAGLAEARHVRPVRTAVIVCAAVTGVWGALDEYTPLLILDTGVAAATVPLLLLIIWSAATAGSLLAGRAAHLRTPWFVAILIAAAVLMATGALLGTVHGILLVAAAFGGFQLASVVADARLQARITGPARATVTSLAGMATDVSTLAVYAVYAALSTITGNGGSFAVLALPYALVAAWMLRSDRQAVVPEPTAGVEPFGPAGCDVVPCPREGPEGQ